MADLGWFRHFGQRPKTPTIPGVPPDEPDYFSSPGKSTYSPTRRLRPPAVRRVSSLLSLAAASEHNASSVALPVSSATSFKAAAHISDAASSKSIPAPDEHHVDLNSPSATTTAVRHKSPEVFLREADRVWHAPSLEQMIESLQVAMMNKPSTLQPLPIQYNGHVLALLEGYGRLRRELEECRRGAADEVDEVKKLRIKELESYRLLTEDWLKRQREYDAEIKRLELLLAHHTEEGMAAVALARAGSVVDRGARARKGFVERVKRLSRGDNGDDAEVTPVEVRPETSPLERKSSVYTHIGNIPLNLDPDHDRRLSQQLKPAKTRSRFSRFTRKHRRPSKANEPVSRQDAAAPDQDPAQGPAQGSGTYVPTGVPPSRGRDSPPSHAEESGRRADPVLSRDLVDSSSSSAYRSSSSTSSSDNGRPVPKGKNDVETGCGDETRGRDIRSNAQALPPLRGGTDVVPTHHGTRTMGELAIERFLEAGTIVPGALEHGLVRTAEYRPQEAIDEDYFTQPRRGDQRRRARGFSFVAGDDSSLPVSPMALPSPIQPDGDDKTERQKGVEAEQTTKASAPSDIRQPRPWSTISHSTGASIARQLQQAVSAEAPSTELAPAVTTPAQALGSLFVPTAVTTPSDPETQPRPTSTGSVIYIGEQQPSAGSRDSIGSRVTVLRDNSGRASRRQSSQSQTTSDNPSLEPSDSKTSAAMPPITEGRRLEASSPTPCNRGGSKSQPNRRSRGGMSSAASSPAAAPAATAEAGGDPGAPTPPFRAASNTGGSEASGPAGHAARIAAALAHARGQKRSQL